jgi:hypothetical protein
MQTCFNGFLPTLKAYSSKGFILLYKSSEKVVNPGQVYSLGPAWELLDSAQRTVLNNQPRAVKTVKQRRGIQLTPCVPGGTASVET